MLQPAKAALLEEQDPQEEIYFDTTEEMTQNTLTETYHGKKLEKHSDLGHLHPEDEDLINEEHKNRLHEYQNQNQFSHPNNDESRLLENSSSFVSSSLDSLSSASLSALVTIDRIIDKLLALLYAGTDPESRRFHFDAYWKEWLLYREHPSWRQDINDIEESLVIRQRFRDYILEQLGVVTIYYVPCLTGHHLAILAQDIARAIQSFHELDSGQQASGAKEYGRKAYGLYVGEICAQVEGVQRAIQRARGLIKDSALVHEIIDSITPSLSEQESSAVSSNQSSSSVLSNWTKAAKEFVDKHKIEVAAGVTAAAATIGMGLLFFGKQRGANGNKKRF